MNIRVLWVGKTKERFAREAVEKYLRFLKPFCRISTVSIKEEKGADRTRAVRQEGKRILEAVSDFVLLHEEGKEFSSVRFAEFLGRRQEWAFVLGGPHGVSDEVRGRARDVLSLSRMTFTHDMARMILLEQLYRAFTILHKRGYHY